MLLVRAFCLLDIEELTYINDHPAATLYRREMPIPFFDPVLGENELATLGLKGFGVTRKRKNLPAAKTGRFLIFSARYWLGLFVSLDIKELAYIDDHPAATLYCREMTTPFFIPVLGENGLSILCLKGFGVIHKRKNLPSAKPGRFSPLR